jgi:hypothetical protein
MKDDAVSESARDLRMRLKKLDLDIDWLQRQRSALLSALQALENESGTDGALLDQQQSTQANVTAEEDKTPPKAQEMWVPGDSVAAAIRATARELIWSQKRPVDRREVLEAAVRRGIPVGGRDPSKTVTRILTRSSQFTNTGAGYVMTDFHARKA